MSAWDQNVPYYVSSPAMAVVEETAAEWMVELLGLTPGSAVGFTSGAQEAIYTGLITARNTLLQRAGWDVATQGLYGAPRINVVLSDQIHSTIKRALSMIGIGLNDIIKVPTDDNLRMLPEALRDIMANCEGPTLVCAQAAVSIPVRLICLMRLPIASRHTRMRGAMLMVRLACGCRQ